MKAATIITMRQAAQLLGCNLGAIILIRASGSKLYDQTFPAMTDGNFNQAEILAWQAAKANKAAAATNSDNTSAQLAAFAGLDVATVQACLADEVQAINAARIAGQTETEIRQLVDRLHARRLALYPLLGGA